MDKNTFWEIIDAVNSEVSDNDYEGILHATQEKLGGYSPEDIARWGAIQRKYKDLADTGGIFAAACALNDYMSSDGYNDFRMWLISQGRDVYMAALNNPDTLAALELPDDIQTTMDTRFESYGYVANYAYESTGCKVDFYDEMERNPLAAEGKADLKADIKYFPHKIPDEKTMARYFPNLYAKYVPTDREWGFSYSYDKDIAAGLLGDSPSSLKGMALKALTDTQTKIRQTVALLGLSTPNQQLNNLRDVITGEIENAIRQIRGYDQTRKMMTADNIGINSDDGLFADGDRVTAYLDTYFDVDKRFGLQTEGTNAYVDLCANYYPEDDSLSVYYILHDTDGTEREPFPVDDLTGTEQETILQLMKDAGLDDLVAGMNEDQDSGITMQ